MDVKRRSLAKGALWAMPAIAATTYAPAYAASPGDCVHTCQDLAQANNTGSNPFWFGNDGTGSNADAQWNGSGKFFTDGNGWRATSNTPWQNRYRDDDYWNGDARISRVFAWGPRSTPTCDASGVACNNGSAIFGESVVLFSGDPLNAGQFWTYYSQDLCLEAGTYTFSFDWRYVGCYWRTQYMQASMIEVRNGAEVGARVNMGARVEATSRSDVGAGTRTGVLVVPTKSRWRWEFKWSSNDTDPNAGALPVSPVFPAPGSFTGRRACNYNTNDIGVSKPRCVSRV